MYSEEEDVAESYADGVKGDGGAAGGATSAAPDGAARGPPSDQGTPANFAPSPADDVSAVGAAVARTAGRTVLLCGEDLPTQRKRRWRRIQLRALQKRLNEGALRLGLTTT